MSTNGYDRFGMTCNPFKELRTEDVSDISSIHVNQPVDDLIAGYKEKVFDNQQSISLLLTGAEGMGKTHRLHVSAYEAAANNITYAFLSIASDSSVSVCDELATQILTAKKVSVFNTPKWHSELSKLAKKVRKGNGDCASFGRGVAQACNENAPFFLLINDLHNLTYVSDSESFCIALHNILTTLAPGVFVMMTSTAEFAEPFLQSRLGIAQSLTDVILLPPLSAEESQAIIGKRINSCRLVEAMDPIYPFSPDSISSMTDSSYGKPTLLIRYADASIQYALEHNALAIDEPLTIDAIGFIKQPYTAMQEETSHQEHSSTALSEHSQIQSLQDSSDENIEDDEKSDLPTDVVSDKSCYLESIPPTTLEEKACGDDLESPTTFDGSSSSSDALSQPITSSSLPQPIFSDSKQKENIHSVEPLHLDDEAYYDDELDDGFEDEIKDYTTSIMVAEEQKKNDDVEGQIKDILDSDLEEIKDDETEERTEDEDLDALDSKDMTEEVTIEEKTAKTVEEKTPKKDSEKKKAGSSKEKPSGSSPNKKTSTKKKGKEAKTPTKHSSKKTKDNSSQEESTSKTTQKKKQTEKKEIQGRSVKVRCPECEEIFPIVLTEETTTLVCPLCGFEGEL